MLWDNVENNMTRAHYQKLALLRAHNEALRVGEFRTWRAEASGLYAYERFAGEERLLCVLNTAKEPIVASLPLPESFAAKAAVHDLYAQNPARMERHGRGEAGSGRRDDPLVTQRPVCL
jgi:glycosidase